MALLTVDEKTCNRDGICAAVCPMGIIDFSKGQLPKASVDAVELCIVCGHCVAVCPTASISHAKMAAQQCPPVQKDFQVSAQQCEQFLRSRRSIRTYKNKPVPRKDIARLITVASHSPSGHNAQSPRWRVIDSAVQIKKLAGTVIDWMRWMVGYPRFAYNRLPLRNPPVISWWDER